MNCHSLRLVLATALVVAGLCDDRVPQGRERAGQGQTEATRPSRSSKPTKPITVFLVRHAETDHPDKGERKLTPAGQARADALAHLLRATAITHLFSSTHLRTKMTIAPLAKATGLKTVAVDARGARPQADALLALAPGSIAVVAGHSNTLPALAKRLGLAIDGLDRRGYLVHDSHDRLFVLTLSTTKGQAGQIIELRFGSAHAGKVP